MKKFKRLTDESLMPWGKFKDSELQDVPAAYLLWLERENINKTNRSEFLNSLLVYIEENRDVLQKELKSNN